MTSSSIMTERIARQSAKEEMGVIEKVSIQGNDIYAIIRRTKQAGLEKPALLFGNEAQIEEQKLTMAEVLIPLDIKANDIQFDPLKILGESVTVQTRHGDPIMAQLNNRNRKPRTIDRDRMKEIRAMSKDPSNIEVTPKIEQYLAQFGYTKEDIDLTIKDNVENVNKNAKTGVIRYGDEEAWDRSSTDDGGKNDWKNTTPVKIVTGLSKHLLKQMSCHVPVQIFQGRS